MAGKLRLQGQVSRLTRCQIKGAIYQRLRKYYYLIMRRNILRCTGMIRKFYIDYRGIQSPIKHFRRYIFKTRFRINKTQYSLDGGPRVSISAIKTNLVQEQRLKSRVNNRLVSQIPEFYRPFKALTILILQTLSFISIRLGHSYPPI